MRVSSTECVALDAMVDLALRDQAGPVPLSAIALRQRMSVSYLEQLFSRLRRAGLVRSIRGPGGGYRLCHEAVDISVAAVLKAVELPPARADADRVAPSRAAEFSARLECVMYDYMTTVSLADLLLGLPVPEPIAEAPVQRSGVTPRPPASHAPAGAANSVFDVGRWMALSEAATDQP